MIYLITDDHMIKKSMSKNSKMVEKELSGTRILVVEDDKIIKDMLTLYLSRHGADVVTADNGRQALEKIDSINIDIVLMDIRMPIMDGIEATARIRSEPHNKDLPVIAVTADFVDLDIGKNTNYGFNEYLPKPIDFKKLMEIIVEWISPQGKVTL